MTLWTLTFRCKYAASGNNLQTFIVQYLTFEKMSFSPSICVCYCCTICCWCGCLQCAKEWRQCICMWIDMCVGECMCLYKCLLLLLFSRALDYNNYDNDASTLKVKIWTNKRIFWWEFIYTYVCVDWKRERERECDSEWHLNNWKIFQRNF